ncbi:MAG: hypothetical protein CV088_16115 [Nitrospira sp. LK70]|nr:hypothetical protein [Nitrospira sp. LK70]
MARICSADAEPAASAVCRHRTPPHLGWRSHRDCHAGGVAVSGCAGSLCTRAGSSAGPECEARPTGGIAGAPHGSGAAPPTARPDSHTDQGALYISGAYQQLLAQTGLVASMSRKGNCYDSAVVESFFSTLKNELIHEREYHSRDEAHVEIFEFIEVFYNRQRLHRTLDYVSPVQFEATRVP